MKRFVTFVGLAFLYSASALAKDTSVVFFGDWGQANAGQAKVSTAIGNYCRTASCDFALTLGDNFYPAGVKSISDPHLKNTFHKYYDALSLRFYASLGNHDYGGNPDAQVQYSKVSNRWAMPARYYEFSTANAAFFAVDTNAFDAIQAAWLSSRLAASRAPWKLVYGHHPIYSSGMHGDTKELVRNLLPLIKGKADFYLCGHDHDKEVLKAEGKLQFVVVGTAAETRPISGNARTRFKAATLGFGHLKISGTEAHYEIVDAEGRVEFQETLRK